MNRIDPVITYYNWPYEALSGSDSGLHATARMHSWWSSSAVVCLKKALARNDLSIPCHAVSIKSLLPRWRYQVPPCLGEQVIRNPHVMAKGIGQKQVTCVRLVLKGKDLNGTMTPKLCLLLFPLLFLSTWSFPGNLYLVTNFGRVVAGYHGGGVDNVAVPKRGTVFSIVLCQILLQGGGAIRTGSLPLVFEKVIAHQVYMGGKFGSWALSRGWVP